MSSSLLLSQKVKPSVDLTIDNSKKSAVKDSAEISNTPLDREVIDDTTTRPQLVAAEDGIDKPVNYGAIDTQRLDVINNEMHLYGDAYVKYENYEIRAGYIRLNLDENIAFAQMVTDDNGDMVGRPVFKDGTQEVGYDELKYNFKTKKGIVKNSVAQEGEFFLHGARTKFVSKDSDSLYFEDKVYNSNALITTCDADHPHYGIRSRKLKLIPDRVAVMGPANLEIAGVPTPLVLPFGFFPLTSGVSSGFIFPKDYEYSPTRGFGFRGMGYYFPINERFDLTVTGDYYTRGSYGLRFHSKYKKRYAYNGNLTLGFANNRFENLETGQFDGDATFRIDWTHNQDSKAHPYRKLSGGVNFETGNYRQNNFNDADAQLTNTYKSNLNFTHSLPGTPFSLRSSFSHDQNTQTNVVNVSFPNIRLNMNSINPFERKGSGGNKKWYEKITLKYDAEVKAYVKATDTTMFTQQTIDDIQYGISQTAKTDASFRMLKYLNVSPSASVDEVWFFKTLEKQLNPEAILDSTLVDSLATGEYIYDIDTSYVVEDNIVRGFQPYRRFNTGISMNTQIFGTKTFKRGKIRGIRHIMKPTVSFNYSPDTELKYQEFVDTDLREEENDPFSYNPFSGGVFSNARLSGEQKSVAFSIINIFEAKYFSKKDSTNKKLKLFDNITMRGNYNFAADSLNWSNITVGGRTRMFGGKTTVNLAAAFNPYEKNGSSFTNTYSKDVGGPILNFESFTANINTRFSVSDLRSLFQSEEKKEEKKSKNVKRQDKPGENKPRKIQQESILDLIDNLTFSHDFRYTGRRIGDEKSFEVSTHTLSVTGSIQLTDNWKFGFSRISYDIKNRSMLVPSFTLERDLHCWRMNFSWQPNLGSYSFFVGVKSSQLSFLKYNYGQTQFDGFGNRF